MKAILIDTNVYSAFKAGDPDVVRAFQKADQIHVNATVIGELIAGFKAGSRESQNRDELAAFLNGPRVVLDDISPATGEFYAHLYLMLRLKGTPIPTNDLWIAASALQKGCALFSLDSHFEVIEGLLRV